MHTIAIGSIATFLYIIAAALLVLRLVKRIDTPNIRWQSIGAAFAAISLHGLIVFEVLFTATGLNLSIFSTLSLLTWLISLLLVFSSLTHPTENLGIILFPSAAITIVLESYLQTERITNTLQTTIEVHILISIIAYSLLSIAAVQALLLALQNNHLRNRQPGGFIRALPPLQTMERLLFQMIGLGFFMQSLSLISGIVFVENIFAQHLVHKTALSIVAWILFGTLLWGRWRFGWRGRKAIRWTLSGFAALALSYIGSKIVLEVILGR